MAKKGSNETSVSNLQRGKAPEFKSLAKEAVKKSLNEDERKEAEKKAVYAAFDTYAKALAEIKMCVELGFLLEEKVERNKELTKGKETEYYNKLHSAFFTKVIETVEMELEL